jgi:hypothetical protein
MTVMVGYYTYDQYIKYGIYYETESLSVFVSNFFINATVVVMMLATAVLFFTCARKNVVTIQYNPKKEGSSSYGIEFLNNRPDYWNISVNMETQCLEVTLDKTGVSISKETIDNLFKGELKKS